MRWHRGHVFHISGSTDLADAAEALVELPDGALLVDGAGRIAWVGPWGERGRASAGNGGDAPVIEAPVVDHHGAFLLPGFVDTHLHFPQVHCVDAYGGDGGLLEWLERVVFPSEALLADAATAQRAAADFCRRLAGAGTTTSLVFGSQFPVAQEALAEAVARSGIRMITGRTLMTTGPASARALITDDRTGLALTRAEIERWLPALNPESPFAGIALVPRFALSVEPSTLALLGELNEEFRDRGLYVTTHLNENRHEIQEVRERYGVSHYLDVYDGRFAPGGDPVGASLLGRRTVLAHAVHCDDVELARLVETGTSVAHCPVSQGFLGSGTLPWRRTQAAGVRVALGSDIAAGDEWFMPRVVNAAFKAHMNGPHEPVGLSPAELLHLATLSGAQALDLDERIGNLDPGKDADFVVLDPGRSAALAGVLDPWLPRSDEGRDRDARLFAVLMAVTESAVAGAYVRGRPVSAA